MQKDIILVVDDDPDMQEYLANLIQMNFSMKIILASNGMTALEIIKESLITILITDILMPKMDGIELIQKAKALRPELKVLMISGGGVRLPSSSALDYLNIAKRLTGENNVIRKPFSATDFTLAINKLVTI